MTQDEIIRMAREAEAVTGLIGRWIFLDAAHLERFANLVAEATKAQPQGEPVAYLAKANRFKVCATDQNCMITGLPAELNGRWVALVAAEDDCHLKYTTPPVVPQGEPVAEVRVRPLRHDEYKPRVDVEWLTKPTPGFLYTTPPSVEAEQGEGTAQELDGCPTEKAVLKRFWRGQPIPQEHYPEWYTSVEAAIEVTKEKAAKVCEEHEVYYGKSGMSTVGSNKFIRPKTWAECAAAIRSMK